MSRPDWDKYFISMALLVAKRSTCLRRNYGAVIVKDNRVVSTGYNGSCSGDDNCCDIGKCHRELLGIPAGERYELCKAVHAEQNAILQANPQDMEGATIYIAGWQAGTETIAKGTAWPCLMCSRFIRNAKIKTVKVLSDNNTIEIKEASCLVVH